MTKLWTDARVRLDIEFAYTLPALWLRVATTASDQVFPCHTRKVALGRPMACPCPNLIWDHSTIHNQSHQRRHRRRPHEDRNSPACLIVSRVGFRTLRCQIASMDMSERMDMEECLRSKKNINLKYTAYVRRPSRKGGNTKLTIFCSRPYIQMSPYMKWKSTVSPS